MSNRPARDFGGVWEPLGDIPRPPLGLRPRSCVEPGESRTARLHEIRAAVRRYMEADKEVPAEWLAEAVDIMAGLLL